MFLQMTENSFIFWQKIIRMILYKKYKRYAACRIVQCLLNRVFLPGFSSLFSLFLKFLVQVVLKAITGFDNFGFFISYEWPIQNGSRNKNGKYDKKSHEVVGPVIRTVQYTKPITETIFL